MIDNLIGMVVYNIKRVLFFLVLIFALIYAATHLSKVLAWAGVAITAAGNIWNFAAKLYSVFENAMNHIPS